ncbi:hypothetical protein ID866_8774 [Astraeus odoratus]|nr:hypothetical protein ID866_8774 [Astraeus odoratus]
MNKTQTDKIRLVLDPPLDFEPVASRARTLASLWELLTSNCIEPAQAPVPLLTSFSSECLLCALILKKPAEWTDDDVPEDLETSESENFGLAPASPYACGSTPPAAADGDDAVGFVYVYSGPANLEAEANVGVVIRKDMQRKGYARDAMELVLEFVFDELRFHRVQAVVLDMEEKDQAMLFFTALGFTNEGTRRRAVRSPEHQNKRGAWRDATYLAMLDTDWVVRTSAMATYNPPSTMWDEMFNRHAREREELMDWEERHGRLKRCTSAETIREDTSLSKKAGKRMVSGTDLALPYWSDDYASTSSCQSSVRGSEPPSPRPNICVSCPEEEDGFLGEGHSPWQSPADPPESWHLFGANPARRVFGSQCWLNVSPSHLQALPSIPSTRVSPTGSEYPITIPSPSSPPPDTPSSISEDPESEMEELSPPNQSVSSNGGSSHRQPFSTSSKRRQLSLSSVASASTIDSWTDAQSCLSNSDWDLIDSPSDSDSEAGPSHAM